MVVVSSILVLDKSTDVYGLSIVINLVYPARGKIDLFLSTWLPLTSGILLLCLFSSFIQYNPSEQSTCFSFFFDHFLLQ